MGTLVAEGKEAAVDVGNDHLLTLEFDQLHFASCDLRGLRHRPEVRHRDSSFVDIGASIIQLIETISAEGDGYVLALRFVQKGVVNLTHHTMEGRSLRPFFGKGPLHRRVPTRLEIDADLI